MRVRHEQDVENCREREYDDCSICSPPAKTAKRRVVVKFENLGREGQKNMREVATINFRDTVNDDDASAIVRSASSTVVLALSLKSDGDVEVFLSAQDVDDLISALKRAVADATS